MMRSYKTRQFCTHPPEQRWQYRDYWKCCECGHDFWGTKDQLPLADIVGRPSFEPARRAEPEGER
jgi:hypothetical protein